MATIAKALCWAGSIILLAIGNAAGLVADDTATTLFVVLPVVAVMALNGRLRCELRRKAA